MLVVMSPEATASDFERVTRFVEERGMVVQTLPVQRPRAFFISPRASSAGASVTTEEIESHEGVRRAVRLESPLRLTSRHFQSEDTVIAIGRERGFDLTIGALDSRTRPLVIAAGPCAVESLSLTREIAAAVKAAGGDMLRGGAFKPRTSPYTFQGLGEAGLEILRQAADEFGMPVVTEVMDAESVALVSRYADVLQIGARNMQNFSLLRAVGAGSLPVLLKRGFAATAEELLLAAEHIMAAGNPRVILCERGIRTVSEHTRNTLDLAIVEYLREVSHLPVLVDPSHATGRRRLVPPLARAAAAVGCDGLMLEVHPRPQDALSDGPQALLPEELFTLVPQLRAIHRFVVDPASTPCALEGATR